MNLLNIKPGDNVRLKHYTELLQCFSEVPFATKKYIEQSSRGLSYQEVYVRGVGDVMVQVYHNDHFFNVPISAIKEITYKKP